MDKFRDTIRQIRLNYFRGLISEEDARRNFANAEKQAIEAQIAELQAKLKNM